MSKSFLCAACVWFTFIFVSFFAHAAQEPVDYFMASRFIHMPAPLALTPQGKVQADTRQWKTETDVDGTDLLTAKKGEARAAAMNTNGAVESLITYELKPVEKTKSENSLGLFFAVDGKDKGHLSAVVTCEDSGAKDDIGRICVTATPRLCSDLRTGKGVDPQNLKEMEAFEMRALAAILTLRGAEHQLDNMVHAGNRLGLRTSLQTTKGQLITLAKQVAKELGKSSTEVAALIPDAEPAPTDPAEIKKLADRAKADDAIAQKVLEKTLPRLKSNCQIAGF
jgi:hypothetical protein